MASGSDRRRIARENLSDLFHVLVQRASFGHRGKGDAGSEIPGHHDCNNASREQHKVFTADMLATDKRDRHYTDGGENSEPMDSVGKHRGQCGGFLF
jgi:hypothetical protein